MFTSFKLKSHIWENNKFQYLKDHVSKVAEIMYVTAWKAGIVCDEFLEVIKKIGLCHDFGKGTEYFQDYLDKKYDALLKNHGEISAYFTYYFLPEKWKLFGFIAVKKHHGRLDNLDGVFFSPSDEENLKKIVDSLEKNKDELEAIYEVDLDEFFTQIRDGSLFEKVIKEGKRRRKRYAKKDIEYIVSDFINFQYIWSLLLSADKTQLIKGVEFKCKESLSYTDVEKYKNSIREKLILDKKGIESSPLFRVRDEIFNTILEEVYKVDVKNERIFSINVPTGTGKTLGVYAGALTLKEMIKERRGISSSIIYCLPFTSVIDQNYDVLKSIFDFNSINYSEEDLMKYHSLTELAYKDGENVIYKDYDCRFLVENWQSSMITTTFVQIFNSIFKSGENSIMHRFHKLAGSIIVLDEVQAVNPKYYKIIEAVFKVLSERFNVYIITVTATKPLFLQGRELVTNNKEIFESMKRIEFKNYTKKKTTINEFKEIISNDLNENKDKSFLFILNTIGCAKDIKSYLGSEVDGRKVYYLSTELLPINRLEIINKIKGSKEKCIVVSTQLVEAGVDIDFDVVYRDIAPLDSINQSAGRANRNGIGTKGIVKLYSLLNEYGKEYSKIYSKLLIDTTEKILSKYDDFEECEVFSLNEEYFKALDKISKNKAEEVFGEFVESMKALDFESIRNSFELIEENKNKVDVIVRYDKNIDDEFKKIKGNEDYLEGLNAWRRLNNYRISINKTIASEYAEENELGVLVLDGIYYSKEEGLVLNKTLNI